MNKKKVYYNRALNVNLHLLFFAIGFFSLLIPHTDRIKCGFIRCADSFFLLLLSARDSLPLTPSHGRSIPIYWVLVVLLLQLHVL